MHKIILLVIGAIGVFAVWKYVIEPRKAQAEITPKDGAPTQSADKDAVSNTTDRTEDADIYAKDVTFSAPNIFDNFGSWFTDKAGGFLTSRYANFGEISVASVPVGKVQAVENVVSVTNLTADKVQFAVFSQVINSQGMTDSVNKQGVTLEPKASKTISFLQACPKGTKNVETLCWTSLSNPIPVSSKISKTVSVN